MYENTERYDMFTCFSLLPTFRVMPDNGTRIAFHSTVLSLGPQYEQCKTDRSPEMRCRCTPSVGKPVIGSMFVTRVGPTPSGWSSCRRGYNCCPFFSPLGYIFDGVNGRVWLWSHWTLNERKTFQLRGGYKWKWSARTWRQDRIDYRLVTAILRGIGKDRMRLTTPSRRL